MPNEARKEAAARFADLASQYVKLYSKKHNKSWKQAEKLVARYLLPRWGKMKASAISRADVRAMMIRIEAPIVANQVLASAIGDLHMGGETGDHHGQPVQWRSTAIRPLIVSGYSPTPSWCSCGLVSNRR